MAKVTVFDMLNSVVSKEEASDLSHETTVQEVDNNDVNIKAYLNEDVEQAEEQDEIEDGVTAKNDNDNQLATSMEEFEAELGGQDLIEQVDETEETFKDLDQTEGAIASVEAYLDLLKGMERKGFEVSKETARAIQIGLEAYNVNYASDVVSIEEAGDESSAKTSSNRLVARLKRLFEIAKRIAIKAIDMAKNLWNSVTTNTTKLESTLKGLQGKIAKAEDVNLEGVKVSKLMGKGNGVDMDVLKSTLTTSRQVMGQLPAAIEKFANNAVDHFKDYEPGEGETGTISQNATNDFMQTMNGEFKRLLAHNPSSGVFESSVLSGNTKVVVTLGSQGKIEQFLSSYGMGSGIIDVKLVGGGESSSAGDLKLSASEQKELAQIASGIINLIKDTKENQEMIKKTEKAYAKSVSEKDAEDPRRQFEVCRASMMKDAIRANVLLTGHLFRTAKAIITTLHAVTEQPKAKEA